MKFFEHQLEALAFLGERESAALIMEQGTGKTITMLAHLDFLVQTQGVQKILIVAPLSALGAWQRDIVHFPKVAPHATIINYDKVWRKEEYNTEWDVIVLDEAHKVTHITSKRTKFFIGGKDGRKTISGLNTKSKYRYVLTGTPLGNSKLDGWYALISFLSPNIFGSYSNFQDNYCKMFQLPNTYVKIIRGFKNVDCLNERIRPFLFVKRKIDCLDLPEKRSDEIIYVPLKEKVRYGQIKEGYMQDPDMVMDNQLVAMVRARQLLSGFVMNDGEVHSMKCEKAKYLKDLLDYDDGKKVIFTNFKESVKIIESVLTAGKYKYVVLDGNQKDKNIWRKFQSDDTIDAIIVQYTSGAEGIDLFKASTTIYYEPTLVFNQLEQSRDRTHRIGQTEACSYYHLITEGTIEEDIYETVASGVDFNVDHLNGFK